LCNIKMSGRFAVKVSLAVESDGCKAHCAERKGRVCEFGSAVSLKLTAFVSPQVPAKLQLSYCYYCCC